MKGVGTINILPLDRITGRGYTYERSFERNVLIV